MDILSLTGKAFLNVSAIVLISSILYGFVESIAAARFKRFFFLYGPLVLRSSLPIIVDQNAINIGFKYSTLNGNFKFINPEECLYQTSYRYYTSPYMRTIFSVKGIIRWKDGITLIEGRIPISSSLFIGAFFYSGPLLVLRLLWRLVGVRYLQ